MGNITADFRRAALRSGVVIRSRASKTKDALAYAAVLEMANYGYRVDPDDIQGMSGIALTNMIADARAIKGADRDMTPIYPGFPKQVQELSTLQLLVEQVLHYWTAGAFLPNYPTVVREGLPLADIVANVQELTVLEAGPAGRLFIEQLTTRGVAISEAEVELLRGSVAVARPDAEFISAVLGKSRHGENMQHLLNAALECLFTSDQLVVNFAPSMRNVDQLLRLVLTAYAKQSAPKHADATRRAITALSDKDAYGVSMITPSRPARRAVMSALGNLTSGFYADRLILRNRLWRKVMRNIHPYSQIALTPAARRAADIIHGNVEYRTLDSSVEAAIADRDAGEAIKLLSENRPGALMARCVELLRLPKSAKALAAAVSEVGGRADITTLIRSYNAVVGANFDGVRVVREAGRNNRLLDIERATVSQTKINRVSHSLLDALEGRLAKSAAPVGPVGIASTMAVPLVRRDLSNTDRVVDRGSRIPSAGTGEFLRIFSHWINTHGSAGYLDVGVALLDAEFGHLTTSDWSAWKDNRGWSTYSGDKLVYPGGSAVEFFDIDLKAVRKLYPTAKYAVMTVQSYSGIPLSKVDMVAGTMLRSDPNKGQSFDARTVTSAFSPTTDAFQALPLAFDLDTRELIWLDASSGSTQTGMSAAQDSTIGPVVRDELARPRLTMGELAGLWANAHGVDIVDEQSDRDALLALLD
ncbi:hypothetical protein [Mycobacterium phage WXIN]|nr:hypothetical protein [Mycobacterium phage WXIN]